MSPKGVWPLSLGRDNIGINATAKIDFGIAEIKLELYFIVRDKKSKFSLFEICFLSIFLTAFSIGIEIPRAIKSLTIPDEIDSALKIFLLSFSALGVALIAKGRIKVAPTNIAPAEKLALWSAIVSKDDNINLLLYTPLKLVLFFV